MNLVNASTGFSNFQIHLGHSPHLIPPILPATVADSRSDTTEALCAQDLITTIETDVMEARDNLLQEKVFQMYYANQNQSLEFPFKIGDQVMLLTLHCHQEFKKKSKKQAAKFFPQYDGPYHIIDIHVETSNYTLKLPNLPNTYPTYHASELKPFLPSNVTLFPSHKLPQPQPIVTSDGLEESHVQEIINLW